MDFDENTTLPTVFFTLSNTQYGVNCEFVKTIVILETVHELPDAPPYVRGVQNLRGSIIPLIDLRMLLDMKTLKQEVSEMQGMLEVRRQDHLNWLAALEKSVADKTAFKLTTDPHACAFGKWYDGFVTNDRKLKRLLDKFDEPHKAIHAVGDKARILQNSGKHEEAAALVQTAREHELKMMVELFSSLIAEYGTSVREIVIILEHRQGKPVGLVVDEITAIEELKDFTGKQGDTRNYCIAKRTTDDSPVILLNTNWLFSLVDGIPE